jgi:hypothetical protein
MTGVLDDLVTFDSDAAIGVGREFDVVLGRLTGTVTRRGRRPA